MRPSPPGYGFPLPLGGWPSLLGPSCSRCGFGPSFRRSSGLLAGGQTACGLPRSAPVETRRERVPPLLRGLGAPACAAVKAAGLCQTGNAVWFLAESSSRQPSVATTLRNAASTGVPLHSPIPSFPRPVGLDGSGCPWASPVCCRTPRYRGACAGREPTWALVGVVVSRHRPLIWSDFVSHATPVILSVC
jgi:hypothetical protein